MKDYYRNHLWDILFCFLMSAGLALNVFAGYDSSDARTQSILPIALVCAVCILILFAAGYNRQTMLAGIAAAVIFIIGVLLIVRSAGVFRGESSIDDNPALFWMVTIAVSAICYLLSRWRIGILVLMVAGAVMTAAFCFLEYPVHLPGYLVFFASVILVYLYRVYDISLLASYTGNVRYTRYAAQSTALVLVVALAAGGIYAGIIRPLDLPTQELKLITRLESLEILQKVGISTRTEIPNEDNKTNNENNKKDRTNQQDQEEQEESPKEEKDETQQGDIQQNTQKEKARAVNYRQDHTLRNILLALLAVLIIVSPFVLRILLRRRWEQKVKDAGPTQGAVMIYQYLTKKMKYAGFRRPEEVTLLAYARGQRRAMKSFAAGSVDMMHLTRTYQEIIYGYREIDEVEFGRFWKFYEGFRENMKKKLGRARYALYFFLI